MAEKISSPVTDSFGLTSNGLINGITGLLTKAADTAIDIWGLKEANKTANIGSRYDTGQVDPAAIVPASNPLTQAQIVTQTLNAYMPYIIGGAVLIGGIAFISILRNVKRK